MKKLIVVIILAAFASSAIAAQQEAALPPMDELEVALPDAIACKNVESAQKVASALAQTTFSSPKHLLVEMRLIGVCGAARLPDDFNSPVTIANEGVVISAGSPADDGRRTLFYELPSDHMRNLEGSTIYLILWP